MGQKLRRSLTNKILLFSALLLGIVFQAGYSQSAGDIAILGYDNEIVFVSFTDISSETTIYFTGRNWDGSSFESSEGTVTYTVPSEGITAGQVIKINPETERASNGGAVAVDGNYHFGDQGDEVYAYLGSDQDNPSIFLFALTSNRSWSSAEGTLKNTGLIEGTEALSAVEGRVKDDSRYVGSREGTVSDLKNEIQNVDANWASIDGSGDQSISLNTKAFTLLDGPKVKFTATHIDSSEDSDYAKINVELAETNEKAVNVDIVFLGNTSTASLADIDNYSTQTVGFESDASSGETKTVTISISDDSKFEGTEEAAFQLQNISEGFIIEPGVTTLSIEDNDVPEIIINEIHADPDGTRGDADGNGVVDNSGDEFIELINKTSSSIDISGWTLHDGSKLRHTFPKGTVIPKSRALILFGDNSVSPEGNFGGAIIQNTNESITLDLNDNGDTITLADANGTVVADVTYGSEAGDGESLSRDYDMTGTFVKHSNATDSEGKLYSPGTKTDGTSFGSKHAFGIRGREGWRVIASPVESATYNSFFGELWTQGITGSNKPSGAATLFSWNEEDGGAFNAPESMDEHLTPGKGYLVYVFEDDDLNSSGTQGGFPKIIDSNGTENSSQVNIDVSATNADEANGIDGDEGWNLLGNPFKSEISVTEVIDVLESANSSVSANVHVWKPKAGNGNGSWKTLNEGDLIAPFQAFFVRFISEFSKTQVSFNKSKLKARENTDFYKNTTQNSHELTVQLHGENFYDSYTLEFRKNGSTELDRYDGFKLFSLNPSAISLFGTIENNSLQRNVLPKDLDSNLKLPLSFDANGRTSLTFKWDDKLEGIPSEWDLILIDNEQNREIDLRRNKEYSFNVTNPERKQIPGSPDQKELLHNKISGKDSRFILSVRPNIQGGTQGDIPQTVTLKPNYPNPFNPTTTIPYELTEDADVLLTVWNMIGQKVATLVDGTVEAGTHEVTWNAPDIPSGIYIARFEVNGTVFTRKMTLIK